MKNPGLKIKNPPTRTDSLVRTGNQALPAQGGMTYIELIVVLAIFSLITAVTVFDYRGFQTKLDIKNLASDIGLKVVEAQKSSLSGVLPLSGYDPATWKPSYGVYFHIATPTQFIYFADLNNDKIYNDTPLDTIDITKGNYIAQIDSYVGSTPTPITDSVSITFKRPDSGASFTSNGVVLSALDYVQITVLSPAQTASKIKIYPSGRIEVN